MKKIFCIVSILLVLSHNETTAQAGNDNYALSSVLSSGLWYKAAVFKDGIYRIDYSALKQMGINNPSNTGIYANNFGQLSYYNDDPKPDDLRELAVYFENGSDGIFNDGDYILFFGQGTGRWKYYSSTGEYDYTKHKYSDTAFYFITEKSAPGKKISIAEEPEATPGFLSDESDVLFIHEKDMVNIIKSGREWYQPVSPVNGITINPGFNKLVPGEEIQTRIRVLARAPVSTIFRLYENTEILKSLQVQAVNMYTTTGTYAQISDSSANITPGSSSPVFELKFYNNGESFAAGWLDYIKLQGRKENIFDGTTAFFSDSRSVAPEQITEFTIKATDYNPVIWDITDPVNPLIIEYTKNGDDLVFKSLTDTIRTFVLFNGSDYITPLIKDTPVKNQDLHGSDPADMIIITHPMFLNHAGILADLHQYSSGLLSLITTPEEIYNEFSGGIPDISAIRNFMRMKYLKQSGTQHPLKYLLLFGDGSYENKTQPPLNPNFIPTYQSQNSNIFVSSFTSDDFYGLLEDGEGEAEGTEDIGIGRLPVTDTIQAGIVISKIKNYLDPSNNGEWKNIICIVADDEDGNTHISDAEGLASLLRDSVPSYTIDKLYLDAFKQVTSVNGQSYPDVVKAINNRINSGCLVFNYLGHGSESGLAHERVVKTDDINAWQNKNRLPLFITATCEFSRFDDMEINTFTGQMTPKTSAGEMVLLSEKGGGIALMSTTRVVYSAPNYILNKNIYNYAFKRDSSGNALRLGDIIKLAKNSSGSGANKRNFSLLGDPALRLAYPWHGKVVTDSVNSKNISETADSLKALSTITISGHIEDNDGLIMNGFNGVVSPVVFDKVSTITTLANDGGQTMQFEIRNNVLFRGNTNAGNGKFSFTFIVPRDIDYKYGPGKISYYATDNLTDMNGHHTDIIVGGFAESVLNDTAGPGIKLYMNDTLFRNGGITDKDPRILAIIEDSGGINTTGSGIGHDVIAYLDNNRNNSFILNNYFENDFDKYTSGKISYNLYDLEEGSHTLTLKAWDNYNNSSEKTIVFMVEQDGKFILTNLLNYPNPVRSETLISAEHNRPDDELEVTVKIFDMRGRIIRILRKDLYSSGYRLTPIEWDGKTESGRRVAKGLYPYSVTITSSQGETVSASGQMIIL